jgi:hypothetical protein
MTRDEMEQKAEMELTRSLWSLYRVSPAKADELALLRGVYGTAHLQRLVWNAFDVMSEGRLK